MMSCMVLLHVKRGEESLFLLEVGVSTGVGEVLERVVQLHNATLKVLDCADIEQLAEYGPSLPPEMQGLADEQIEELNLKDDWAEKSVASGGEVENRDPTGRRCGRQPTEKIRKVLLDAVREAKGLVSKELAKAGTPMTLRHPQDALALLGGAVTMAYPAGLPPHDPVREERESRERLEGTQAGKMVLESAMTQLWFAGKELQCDKRLRDYLGNNEKTKVIVKVQRRGVGAPAREPQLTPDQQKALMVQQFKRREELQKLEEAEDDSYLDSSWADSRQLHRSFQGLCNITWKPH
ncbi:hypothetical protein O3P69_019537 [Scylla paramamosain]|uniref:Cilia- and flagella-associated protein 298 n=2 Tax=Scylla paramamosain TaxID=85552 RepID=A0AAW0SXC9_SCYPA